MLRNVIMPTINLKRKILQPKIEYKIHEQQQYYSSGVWQRLRNLYIKQNPLCECCLSHDVYTPAEHVHHRRMFMSGEDNEERWKLLADTNNLMSVCRKCHEGLHRKQKKYNLKAVDDLTDKEYNFAHNKLIY